MPSPASPCSSRNSKPPFSRWTPPSQCRRGRTPQPRNQFLLNWIHFWVCRENSRHIRWCCRRRRRFWVRGWPISSWLRPWSSCPGWFWFTNSKFYFFRGGNRRSYSCRGQRTWRPQQSWIGRFWRTDSCWGCSRPSSDIWNVGSL